MRLISLTQAVGSGPVVGEFDEACIELDNGAQVYVKHGSEGLIIDVYPNDDVSDTIATICVDEDDLDPDPEEEEEEE